MTELSSSSALSSAAPSECDVLVIGGGPAGATAGALLAQQGYKVVVLEKAHHPRFHIGESLLPANLPLFERLGVADAVKAIGMEKMGGRIRLAVARQQDADFQVFRRLGQIHAVFLPGPALRA